MMTRRPKPISWREILASSALALSLALSACGRPQQTLPQLNESGAETGEIEPAKSIKTVTRDDAQGSRQSASSAALVKTIRLSQATNLRTKKNGVLEFLYELPPNSEIQVSSPPTVDYSSYRNSGGSVIRDTNGFAAGVQVVSIASSVASSALNKTPTRKEQNLQSLQRKIQALNKTAGGLFIAASTVTGSLQVTKNFEALKNTTPLGGYLMVYELSGQPKFKYRKGLQKRFGAALNQPVKVTPVIKERSLKLLGQLALAVGRETPTPESFLFANIARPQTVSIEIEKTLKSPQRGAWTIAVLGTAKLHGFSNEPCAEFVSEEIRESYARAGLNFNDDFNTGKGNNLIWSKTAAVAGLGRALVAAGWTPWSTDLYVPPTGAVMMAEEGQTPGHAYFSGGAQGRFIVDNGSPQGRDLGQTRIETLRLMYQTGVFFLPPGLQPQVWSATKAGTILMASLNSSRI